MKGTKKKHRLLSMLLSLMLVVGMMPAMSTTVFAGSYGQITLNPGEHSTVDVECSDITNMTFPNDTVAIKSTNENVARPTTNDFYLGNDGLKFELDVYAVGPGDATIQVYNKKTGLVYELIGVVVNNPKVVDMTVCKGVITDFPVGYVGNTSNASATCTFSMSNVLWCLDSTKRVNVIQGGTGSFFVSNPPYLINDIMQISLYTLGNYSMDFYDPSNNHVASYNLTVKEHEYGSSLLSEATCKQKAVFEFKCKNCGDSYTQEIGDFGNHKWADYYSIDKAATCEEDGIKSVHCSLCDEKEPTSETMIPAIGHTWDEEYTVDKEATCTEKGSKSIHCSKCNATKDVVELDKIAHEYGEWIIDKNPTCEEAGSRYKECTCGDRVTEEIVAIGHEYESETTKATTSENGSVATKCSGCGDVKSSETIYYPKTMKLSTTNYTYSGGTKTPTVSIIDANGNTVSSANYNVSYASGRKNVGSYKVTVTFKGDKYSGSKYTYFDINPKGTSISKVSGAKKAFTVKWKKQSSKMTTTTITGYQIRYSTSSKMTSPKYKTVKGYKSTSKKITKLSAKKKYYVQVRTYKTVSGKTYYSSWSSVKSVKTK